MALLVTMKKNCHVVPQFTVVTDDYEILTIRCKHELISVLYRPPNGSIASFLLFYETFLEFVCNNNLHLVSAGDFNINMMEESNATRDLNTLLHSTGFTNLITTPTRITCSTASALDLIVTNIDTVIYSAGTVISDISDHCPVFLNYYNEPLDRNSRQELLIIQQITPQSIESFKIDIMNQSWSSVYEKKTANDAYDDFMKLFMCIYAKHFPFKTFTPAKKAKKPWVTREHLKMIKSKNICYHSFLRTRRIEVLKEFKKLRNRINAELRRAKEAYYRRLFENTSRQRPNATWKLINNILGRENKNALPESLTLDGRKLTGTSLANRMNNHFINAVSACNDHVG